MDLAWRAEAACRDLPPSAFFPAEGHTFSSQERATLEALCRSCPVTIQCDIYARETASDGWWSGSMRTRGRPRKARSVLVMAGDPLLSLGFTTQQASEARRLVTAMDSTGWRLGDLLVEALGPTGAGEYHDGSRARLLGVAEALGVSVTFLRTARSVSTAWPAEDRRPECSWATHRILRGDPDRVKVLTSFVDWCAEQRTSPSDKRLVGYLAWNDGRVLPPKRLATLPADVRALVSPMGDEPAVSTMVGDDLDGVLDRFLAAAQALAEVVREHPDEAPRVREVIFDTTAWLAFPVAFG